MLKKRRKPAQEPQNGLQVKHKLLRRIKDTDGSQAVEMVYVCAALCFLILSVLLIIGYALQANAISYAAKRATRQIEVLGQYNQSVATRMMREMLANYDEIGGSITATPNSGSWLNSSKKTIQLRDKFTVHVHCTYTVDIGTLAFKQPLRLRLPIDVYVIGQSEVYWKH